MTDPIGNLSSLNGTWVKDGERSTSMQHAMDTLELRGIRRNAVRLVRGIELKLSEQPDKTPMFEMAVFSRIPLLKVRERYVINGPPGNHNRRDLRRGKFDGKAVWAPNGNLQMHLEWGEPFPGREVDEYQMVGQDELHVKSHITLNDGRESNFTSVHFRKGTKHAHAAASAGVGLTSEEEGPGSENAN